MELRMELTGILLMEGCKISITFSPMTWRSLLNLVVANILESENFVLVIPSIYTGNSRYYLNKEWERNKESLIMYLQQVGH